MRIETPVNTTLEEIDAKKWNPYLGISINNKAFTADYLAAYMNWAADRAKNRAAILIVDIIQRINNEVLGKYKPLPALGKALNKAGEIRLLCENIMASLPADKKAKLVVLEWPDVVQEATFLRNYDILTAEFERNPAFRNALVSITRRNLGEIVSRLDSAQAEQLSLYVLNELPTVLMGFIHDGVHYNLNAYPGKIAEIYSELMGQEFFEPILSRLHKIGGNALIEAYQ